MKDNCSYRFDAILAVALEQDARQELAALPTPAALKELYPDTSSLDARILLSQERKNLPVGLFCNFLLFRWN